VSSFDEAYEAVRSGTPLELDCDVVEVRGPDALTYLQGQMSQDVAAMGVSTAVVASLLLEPNGKLGFLVGIARVAEDVFVVTVDRPSGPDVLARLDRFKLRTDAGVRICADEWHVVTSLVEGVGAGESVFATELLELGLGLDDDLAAAYDVVRIERGVPRMRNEIRGEIIPAELGRALIDAAASFTKGCYTGQELVARVDSRGGNVPRHLRGLVVESSTVPAPGDEIVVGDKVVGELTSTGWSPHLHAPVALGFVHRSVDVPGTVGLRGSIDASATVAALASDQVGRPGDT
jgi:folate-binding protein YgfZ